MHEQKCFPLRKHALRTFIVCKQRASNRLKQKHAIIWSREIEQVATSVLFFHISRTFVENTDLKFENVLD